MLPVGEQDTLHRTARLPIRRVEAEVCHVRLDDQGRQPWCVKVSVQGVPIYGLVDSGADITIIGRGVCR